jgi:hypothetical protein
MTVLSVPVVLVDNLPREANPAVAVETVAPDTTSTTATTTTIAPTTTTPPPATTAPPTTAPPTSAPTTATTTAPPSTAVRRAAPPPTTAPPTTAVPAPPPPARSVEDIIRARFGPVGDTAIGVARCESGLNPSARSPAGYRGLFQLDPSHAASFQQVTGRDFEEAWDEADPNTQYAKYLYDRSGWSPWGACAPD